MGKLKIHIIVPLTIIGMAYLFSDSLYAMFGMKNYTSIHMILELMSIVVSFTIAIQAWMIFPHTLSNHRLVMGGLFLAIGILDLLHTISYKGMPFFFSEGSVQKATWFWIVARSTSALFFIIVLLPEKVVRPRIRYYVYLLFIAYAIVWACVIIIGSEKLPILVMDGIGTTLLKNMIEYVIISLHLITLWFVVRFSREKNENIPIFTIALFYLIFAEFMFTQYIHVYDIKNFIGHLFKVAGYYYLLHSIYISSVEEPYKAQKETEAIMKHMAYHDELTGLPNLRYFKEKLAEVIMKGDVNALHAVVMLNIARFGFINDSLGYSMGDKLLQKVADRLVVSLPKDVFISRMSTNQFILYVTHKHDLQEISSRIIESFSQPLQIEHLDITIQVRMGIAHYSKEVNNMELLIQSSHTAMNEAKRQNKEFIYYHSLMNEKSYERLILESDLHKALDEGQFSLVYQPQIHSHTGKIIAVEALIRWQHPTMGMVTPNKFISILEETGLIIPVGEWVLRTACKQLKAWHNDGHSLGISVNLSVRQFYHVDLLKTIENILKETNLDPSILELEITESMTMDINHAKDILRKLKELGVRISIDDFGTGYSSLSYLKELAIDRLKIDQSFVRGVSTNENDEMIVSTIISMTKHMKIEAVAEGVENLDHLLALKQKECLHLQGYLFSRPLDAATFSQCFDEIQNKAENYTKVHVQIQ
ncbi:EAL domain-containing protein [Ammoniphilus sp. CFH 90114]|uniref:bifunctional diguanylate cyclase/phosphodiesterase n=1 Tax=Ammoniphilus sp. CFH 90114 TaxID=2493665 RepID=UPI00100DBECF|nr:EAL domain-containing protein [Ammoniphilus sp. CFH 90114]RXT07094.1 EAL domain-containing protein [Ammoniphilus sp. CFH 90114]